MLDGLVMQNWGMFPITFEPKQLELLRDVPSMKNDEVTAPCLAFGIFQVESGSMDTYLSVDQWTKVGFISYFVFFRSMT